MAKQLEKNALFLIIREVTAVLVIPLYFEDIRVIVTQCLVETKITLSQWFLN